VTGGIYLALEAAGNPAAAPTTITSSNLIPASTTGCDRHTDDDPVHDPTTTTTVKGSKFPALTTGRLEDGMLNALTASSRSGRWRDETGTALVELALVSPW